MNLEYETPRLLLKVLKPEAAESVLNFYLNNKEIFEKYEPARDPNFYTLAHQKTILTCEYNLLVRLSLVRFWVFEKTNPQKVIGTVCFRNITKLVYDSCECGYKFDQRYWHMGYAGEALAKGIDIMFAELSLHRITALVMPDNQPSIHLLEKLGFSFEGTEKQSVRIREQWQDHLRYALINPLDL